MTPSSRKYWKGIHEERSKKLANYRQNKLKAIVMEEYRLYLAMTALFLKYNAKMTVFAEIALAYVRVSVLCTAMRTPAA